MDARFIIIDCASRAAGTTLKLAAIADLTVFPIPTGEKDLQLSRNTIKAMFKGSERIPPLEPEQLAIVPTRAHTIPEWKASRQWLLDNCPHPERLVIHPPLLERPAYANAMSRGLAITETPYDDLSESARHHRQHHRPSQRHQTNRIEKTRGRSMSTLDGKLARKHSNRFQPARDTTDPIIFPEEGEPSFRVKPVQARPVKRQRKRDAAIEMHCDLWRHDQHLYSDEHPGREVSAPQGHRL